VDLLAYATPITKGVTSFARRRHTPHQRPHYYHSLYSPSATFSARFLSNPDQKAGNCVQYMSQILLTLLELLPNPVQV
jgi:hypothetical protein